MTKKHSFDRGEASQRQLRVQNLKSALNEILIRGETKNPILDNIMVTITHEYFSRFKKCKILFGSQETDKTDVILKRHLSKVIRKK